MSQSDVVARYFILWTDTDPPDHVELERHVPLSLAILEATDLVTSPTQRSQVTDAKGTVLFDSFAA